MRSWRRFLRRKQKRFILLSLLSLLNIVFPQHAQAAEPKLQPTEPAVSVIRLKSDTVEPVKVAVAPQPVAPRTLLPNVPQLPAKGIRFVKATAYTSSVDETDGSPDITASGARTRDGIIAANGLKFGTRVRFPDHYGDKIFVVQDRMNSRYGSNYVDIWMTTKTLAKQWGVRNVRMEIL